MSTDFNDDEGWWAVGAHVFTIIFSTLAVWLSVEYLFRVVPEDALVVGLSCSIGVPLGHRVFHRMRRRFLGRRQRTES
ncbi:hypothetical protein [Catellatospora sichuanensis]|uniref:hypothetical protein n=1 Tax=Catellatospora sichuanensis TaxID=1969805 RepID=UPI001183C9FC|nr:hypothetical protein [Catellatospora sichuanensis]